MTERDPILKRWDYGDAWARGEVSDEEFFKWLRSNARTMRSTTSTEPRGYDWESFTAGWVSGGVAGMIILLALLILTGALK